MVSSSIIISITHAAFRIALCLLQYQPGTIAQHSSPLSDTAQAALYSYYNRDGPRVHYELERYPPPGMWVLKGNAQFYNYAILDGRRITPTTRSRREFIGSSIIKHKWNGSLFGGEVVSIFHHVQGKGDPAILFAEIRWMKRSTHSPLCASDPIDPWRDLYVLLSFSFLSYIIFVHSPELDVETWELDSFLEPNSRASPPAVIPFNSIISQLSRATIDISEPVMWITTSQDRVRYNFCN